VVVNVGIHEIYKKYWRRILQNVNMICTDYLIFG